MRHRTGAVELVEFELAGEHAMGDQLKCGRSAAERYGSSCDAESEEVTTGQGLLVFSSRTECIFMLLHVMSPVERDGGTHRSLKVCEWCYSK